MFRSLTRVDLWFLINDKPSTGIQFINNLTFPSRAINRALLPVKNLTGISTFIRKTLVSGQRDATMPPINFEFLHVYPALTSHRT